MYFRKRILYNKVLASNFSATAPSFLAKMHAAFAYSAASAEMFMVQGGR